jgi:hypothetical protein
MSVLIMATELQLWRGAATAVVVVSVLVVSGAAGIPVQKEAFSE